MRSEPLRESHWTDEELIASLYDVGPENSHLERCEGCNSRRSFLVANRYAHESSVSCNESLSFEFLAAQRRAVYRILENRWSWLALAGRSRLIPAVLSLLLVSGVVMYQRQHSHQTAARQISDAQLALEVSKMSQEWQAEPAAPLEGLFE